MNTSARSSQSCNRLTKIAEVVNFVVDYPDWEFMPVKARPFCRAIVLLLRRFFKKIMFVVFYK